MYPRCVASDRNPAQRSLVAARDATADLFAELLGAPDRDACPGARSVLSFSDQDEREYRTAIDRHSLRQLALSRRGVWHGEWAELDPRAARAHSSHAPALAARWHAARPIVLPAIARDELAAYTLEIAARDALHAELKEPGGLKRWLDERAGDLEPQFARLAKPAPLFDRERDIERWFIESVAPAGRGKRVRDLWLKSAWLSTHGSDDSLRVRASFGREQRDDASGDLLRQRLVAELASALWPESALVSANPRLVGLVERFAAEPVLFTQHIAYWNGPEGGASFHHDAFAEDGDAVAGVGQLGVGYVQLSGSTAWLALSIADLASRVREFAASLGEGALPWVRAQIFPTIARWKRFEALVADARALAIELALPGCGELGPLVNRGPEFTSFLADAGHAYVLDPGDAILLPNHGLERTAMHSVFCAGDETGYALSLAIRPDRETRVEGERARISRP